MNGSRAVARAFAVLVCTASLASAAPLLSPAKDARAVQGLAGIAAVGRLALDGAALTDLRGRRDAVLEHFPLGTARTATLELERVDPFGPGARLEVVDAAGTHAVPAPDRTWFVGRVRGEPGSRALLVAGPDQVHGFVVASGDVYPFGPDAAGHHRSYALSSAGPSALAVKNDFCLQDVHGPALEAMRQALTPAGPEAPPPVRTVSGALLGVDVAIDTDQELRAKFGSTAATLDYIGSLVAAANLIYEQDARVRLRASYVRVWSTTDPWSSSDTIGALDELRNYWTNPANNMESVAGPRDVVHFVSGKNVSGGVAYLSALCSTAFGYGVSQVEGDFDTASPTQIWDVVVFSHELGHNLGSPHTHCYSPPIDKCYASENGCYSGPVIPTSNGTLMSYCHLNAGGLANVKLLFGDRPSDVIRTTVTAAACVTEVDDGGGSPNCGNGTLDPGEDCDDGNTTPGDGCSASCTIETTCGDGVVAGSEECDDGNTTAADGCSPVCHLEVCGNGVLDGGETCDDGNTTSGDGCSPSCAHEPRCGDGTVDAGEECDDGNVAPGDGCSALCALEPCTVVIPHQALWAPARLDWARTRNTDRLKVRARFGVPGAAGVPAPDLSGLRVFVSRAAGTEIMDLRVPAGSGWGGTGNERRFRGAAGTPGVANARVRQLGGSEVRTMEVRLTATGRWDLDASLPLSLTLVFGGDEASRSGLCGRHDYGSSTCSVRPGRRMTCR